MKPVPERRLLVVASLMLMSAAGARAHDFWLVPNAFYLADGDALEVRAQTSSKFPTSEAAVAVQRVADARVLTASSEERITRLAVAGASLMLSHHPRGSGQRIVAVALHPTFVRASGPGFKRYMELEGATDLAARYDREGLLPKADSIIRRYAKFAKTLVEVGKGGPRSYSRVVGHVAEFVPLTDPDMLRAGDTLALRMLYRGTPLARAQVQAGRASEAGTETDRLSLRTDSDGIIRVPVANAGLWNVRTIHIVPAERESGADWDSHFVTLVFRVGGHTPTTRNNSASLSGQPSSSSETAKTLHSRS